MTPFTLHVSDELLEESPLYKSSVQYHMDHSKSKGYRWNEIHQNRLLDNRDYLCSVLGHILNGPEWCSRWYLSRLFAAYTEECELRPATNSEEHTSRLRTAWAIFDYWLERAESPAVKSLSSLSDCLANYDGQLSDDGRLLHIRDHLIPDLRNVNIKENIFDNPGWDNPHAITFSHQMMEYAYGRVS